VTANDPSKALEMARETYEELGAFRGLEDAARVPWSRIERLVLEFLRLPEDRLDERSGILLKIEAACLEYQAERE